MEAIVLAAGKGTRMRSPLPKVLHPLHGRPLVLWSLASLGAAGVEHAVVVVGHGADQVEARVRAASDPRIPPVTFALQRAQRGTGDALRVGLEGVRDPASIVVVVPGDVPGLRPATVEAVARQVAQGAALGLVAFRPADPTGYGRLVTGGGAVRRIVEEADATEAERALDLCNAGVYAARGHDWARWTAGLTPDNAQGEIYLTDVVELAAEAGPVRWIEAPAREVFGINDPAQLAQAHAWVEPPDPAGA